MTVQRLFINHHKGAPGTDLRSAEILVAAGGAGTGEVERLGYVRQPDMVLDDGTVLEVYVEQAPAPTARDVAEAAERFAVAPLSETVTAPALYRIVQRWIAGGRQ